MLEMNWVGGARNRVRQQNEKKIQKEFFAKQKLGKSTAAYRNRGSPEGHSSKPVSFDLISLQIAQHTCDTRKKNARLDNDHKGKLQLRNLDLSGKGAMDVRNWQKDDIALPMSPILQPSSLELSDSSLYTSDDSLPLANSRLKRPIRNPLLAPKFPQPPRHERTPLVCSPSAMNATHMSSEAVFPKDVPLVQAAKKKDESMHFTHSRKAPGKGIEWHPKQNGAPLEDDFYACTPAAKKWKQDQPPDPKNPRPNKYNLCNVQRRQFKMEQMVPAADSIGAKESHKDVSGFYTTENPIPSAAHASKVNWGKQSTVHQKANHPTQDTNPQEPSKPIAHLRQPSKIGMFSSFEKMMMTIKEGAPRGVQESTPITEHNNVVGVCNEPMVKNSWFKFVSEVPQKEVIVETGNGQEGNPATYQQALEHNLDYLCGELAECSQNPSMKTTKKEEIDEIPLKEKRMYCSALEEVLELGEGLDDMESDHELDVSTSKAVDEDHLSQNLPHSQSTDCSSTTAEAVSPVGRLPLSVSMRNLYCTEELEEEDPVQQPTVDAGYTDIPCCVGWQLTPPAVKGSSSLYTAVPCQDVQQSSLSYISHVAVSKATTKLQGVVAGSRCMATLCTAQSTTQKFDTATKALLKTVQNTDVSTHMVENVDVATQTSTIKTAEAALQTGVQKVDSAMQTAVQNVDSTTQTTVQNVDSARQTTVQNVDSAMQTAVQNINASTQTVVQGIDDRIQAAVCQYADTGTSTQRTVQNMDMFTQTDIEDKDTTLLGLAWHVKPSMHAAILNSDTVMQRSDMERADLPQEGDGDGGVAMWSRTYSEMEHLLKTVNLELFSDKEKEKMAANLTLLNKLVEKTQNNLIWLELLAKLHATQDY